MRRWRWIGLSVLAVVAACSDSDDGKLKLTVTADHVAAVNALVPAEWKARITFELGTDVIKKGNGKDTYRLAVPTGWKTGPIITGSLVPGDADEFGRSNQIGAIAVIRVDSDCNGECTSSKDWAAEVDKKYYRKFTTHTGPGRVMKDDKRDTGRTLVFANDPPPDAPSQPGDRVVNIMTTWWKKGGSQFFLCEVKLEDGAVALAPAFEKACALVSAE